ncbi:aldolase/citrate lyase family protein [Jatrophihabitans sp. DSM 45814]
MNPVKQSLRDGRVVTLINPDHPSPSLVATLGNLGVDAIMIDCEQGSPSLTDVEEMTRAARSVGLQAVVRIPSAQPWDIERHMMRGIDGVVVPRLDSARRAAAAVADIQYCAPNDFDDKVIIVQIESAAAVAELDDFLAIDEIDSLFIGAVDLAKSMGYRGDYSQEPVMAVIEQTIDRITAAGRSAGMLVKEADVARWHQRGVTLLYAHVNDFIRIGARHWRVTAGLPAGLPAGSGR